MLQYCAALCSSLQWSTMNEGKFTDAHSLLPVNKAWPQHRELRAFNTLCDIKVCGFLKVTPNLRRATFTEIIFLRSYES